MFMCVHVGVCRLSVSFMVRSMLILMAASRRSNNASVFLVVLLPPPGTSAGRQRGIEQKHGIAIDFHSR